MVYGELGKYPISVIMKVHMIRFWCRILIGKEFKLSFLLYKLMYINFINYGYENKRLSFIQNILNNCGISNIWLNQNSCSSVWLSSSVEQKLKDQFFQEWSENMNSTSKGLCYRIFKTELKIEKYISILPYNYMFNFCKFRCDGHRLPVETGRWHNVSRADRLCHLCDFADIGDEFHYIMLCSYLKQKGKNIYRVIAVIMSIPSNLISYFLHVILLY
jgi:hypothetical protein